MITDGADILYGKPGEERLISKKEIYVNWKGHIAIKLKQKNLPIELKPIFDEAMKQIKEEMKIFSTSEHETDTLLSVLKAKKHKIDNIIKGVEQKRDNVLRRIELQRENTIRRKELQSKVSEAENVSYAYGKEMVDDALLNANKMLNSILEQNRDLGAPEPDIIRETYTKQISELYKTLKLEKGKPLTKDEIGIIKKFLKESEKKVAEIIRNAQVDIVAEIGIKGIKGGDIAKIKAEIKKIAKNMSSRLPLITWARFTSFFTETYDNAKDAFDVAQEAMRQASETFGTHKATTEADKRQEKDFEQYVALKKLKKGETPDHSITAKGSEKLEDLKKRVNVVGINGIYRIAVSFDPKKIHKQFEAFQAQEQSRVIRETVDVGPHVKMVPYNVYHDEHTQLEQEKVRFLAFEKEHGETGISSHARGPHLVNAWLYIAEDDKGNPICKVTRSGVSSIGRDTAEFSETARKEIAKAAAMEFLKAQALDHISTLISSGRITFEEFRKDPSISLDIMYSSLLTGFTDLIPKQFGNDMKLIRDHEQAFKDLLKEIHEIEIPYKVGEEEAPTPLRVKCQVGKVSGLSTGVNFGAKIPGAYKDLSAIDELQEYTAKAEVAIGAINIRYPNWGGDKKIEAIKELLKDVQALKKSSKNPFELSIRVTLLANRLNEVFSKGNSYLPIHGITPEYPIIYLNLFCMSGSDRTTVAMAQIDVMNDYFRETGRYPSLEELEDPHLKENFALRLLDKLLDPKFKLIQYINKGAPGTKNAASLLSFLKDYITDKVFKKNIKKVFDAIESLASLKGA